MEVQTFTDIYGKRYTNESLLKGIRNNIEYVNLNTGNFLGDGMFNVGNGVAVLSDIKVFGSTSIGVRSRAGKKISWIVIHYTAGSSSKRGAARSCCDTWVKRCTDTPNNPGSADLAVDDVETWQFSANIDEYYTHHSGGKYKSVYPPKCKGKCYNSNSIGIELCSSFRKGFGNFKDPNHGGWYFTDAVLRRGIELTRALMKKYNIDKDHICRHYDCSGKLCPGVPGWNPEPGSNDESQWHRFLNSL